MILAICCGVLGLLVFAGACTAFVAQPQAVKDE